MVFTHRGLAVVLVTIALLAFAASGAGWTWDFSVAF
jgi:hypothetical protein